MENTALVLFLGQCQAEQLSLGTKKFQLTFHELLHLEVGCRTSEPVGNRYNPGRNRNRVRRE